MMTFSSYVWCDVTMTALFTLQHVFGIESVPYVKYGDNAYRGLEFRKEMLLSGRRVTCGKSDVIPENAIYQAPVWSCRDIRISGQRLEYWHMDGPCSDDRNSSSSRVANDYGGLCRQLMELHGIHMNLWSAMIVEASCKQSQENRVIYLKAANSSYVWLDFPSGRGFVISFQCMVDPP